ncbi:MAG TPA: hypothetical protein VGE99_00805 [Candidatus Dormibacteraeota bacterium]
MRVPYWVANALMAGSFCLFLWGGFVFTFTSEPSSVGRLGAALFLIVGASLGTAIVGTVATVGLYRKSRWAPSAAWFASVLMILTCVSSWAAVIAIIGLVSSRRSS